MSTEEFWWTVNIPFDEEINWQTLVTPFEDGKEQRRKKWSTPKRTFTVSFGALSKTQEDQLWDFYSARYGAYDTFYFENPNESPKTGVVSTTTATGTNGAFSFPNYPWTSGDVTVYKNGVASGDYTVTRATGVVTWSAGNYPEAGAVITADYHFAYTVRFMESKLNRQLFSYRLWSHQIKLVQVL